jgi:outer membrane protein TolC
MKQLIILIIACTAGAPALHAQPEGTSPDAWSAVLQSVASNNKELKINAGLSSAVNAQYAAANALPDPEVSYTHQYGNREGLGINGEFIASQSFDFPALYLERSRLAKRKAESLDLRHDALRREILLRAKEICLDLVLLRKERRLLDERLANASQLEQLYARRLEAGDVNQLEANKISLELLNVKTEHRRNAIAAEARLKELEALNGGLPLPFDTDSYAPEESAELPSLEALSAEVLAADPELKALRSEQAVAGQSLRVGRAGWFPGLEIGYQLNTAARGERFSGFLVGLRIPLFSNRQKLRQARAESLSSGLKYEEGAMKTQNELSRLYRSASALKESMAEYERLMDGQNSLPLLNKALESGGISIIEYFVEVASFYDSLRNLMQLENDYRKTVSSLLKHRL